MPYIHIGHNPGADLAQYEKVTQELGPEPIDGNLLHIVGEADGALHIVDVWESAEKADRFAAERLFPAWERLGIAPSPEMKLIAYDGRVTNNLA